jgi:hypothetical protein
MDTVTAGSGTCFLTVADVSVVAGRLVCRHNCGPVSSSIRNSLRHIRSSHELAGNTRVFTLSQCLPALY